MKAKHLKLLIVAISIVSVVIVGKLLWLDKFSVVWNPATSENRKAFIADTTEIHAGNKHKTVPATLSRRAATITAETKIMPFEIPVLPDRSSVTETMEWQNRVIVQTYRGKKLPADSILSSLLNTPAIRSKALRQLNMLIFTFPPLSDLEKVIQMIEQDPNVKHISRDAMLTALDTDFPGKEVSRFSVPEHLEENMPMDTPSDVQSYLSASNANGPIIPNDPEFNNQWGLRDANLPAAWHYTTGSTEVIIAVMDSGIDYTHPDLIDNVWINAAEKNGVDGVDDDNNGYIDDLYGWNVALNYGDPWDQHNVRIRGHGTRVASVIGAVGNNMRDMAGVAWRVKILAIRTHEFYGGSNLSSILEGFDYVVAIKKSGHNLRALNLSASITFDSIDFSTKKIYEASLYELYRNQILLVTSAGNGSRDFSDPKEIEDNTVLPNSSLLPNIISVASLELLDSGATALAESSDYSPFQVDLAAPGRHITTLIPLAEEEDYTSAYPHRRDSENDRQYTDLFRHANILCDDFEPSDTTNCGNSVARASWMIEGSWEKTDEVALSGGYSWIAEHEDSSSDSKSVLTHTPIDISQYLNRGAKFTTPVLLAFRFMKVPNKGRHSDSQISVDIRTEAKDWIPLVRNNVINRLFGLSFALGGSGDDDWRILVTQIPPGFYGEQFQFRVVFNTIAEHQDGMVIDNIALIAIDNTPETRTTRLSSGTSFASPHVAGAVALLSAYRPHLNYLDIRDLILNSVDKRPNLRDKVITGGSLNVAAALALAESTVDNAALFEFSTSSLSIDGTQTATFTMMLTAPPESNETVIVDIEPYPQNNLIVLPHYLSFTSSDWNQPKRITVTAKPNYLLDSIFNHVRIQTRNSGARAYIDVNAFNLLLPEIEMVYVDLPKSVSEDTTVGIQVHLSAAPTSAMIVAFHSRSNDYLNIRPPVLGFTPVQPDLLEGFAPNVGMFMIDAQNWQEVQVLNVHFGNNYDLDSDLRNISVLLYAESSDSFYEQYKIDRLRFKVDNTETLKVTIQPGILHHKQLPLIISVSIELSREHTLTLQSTDTGITIDPPELAFEDDDLQQTAVIIFNNLNYPNYIDLQYRLFPSRDSGDTVLEGVWRIDVATLERTLPLSTDQVRVNEGESTEVRVLTSATPIAVESGSDFVRAEVLVSGGSTVLRITAMDNNHYTGHQTTTMVLSAEGYPPTTVSVTVLETDYFISARNVDESFILYSDNSEIVLHGDSIIMKAWVPDGLVMDHRELSWTLQDPNMLFDMNIFDSFASLYIDSGVERDQIAEILATGRSSVTVTVHVAIDASAESLATAAFTIPIIDFSDVNFVNQGATPILTRYDAEFTLLIDTESYAIVVTSGPHKGFSLDLFIRGRWSVVGEHSDSFFIQSDSDTGEDYLMTRPNIFSTLPNYRANTVIRVQLQYNHVGFKKDLFIPVEVLVLAIEDLQIRKAGEATAIATVVAGDAYYVVVDLSHDFVDVKLRVSYRVEEGPSGLTVSVSGGNSEIFTVPTGSTGFIEVEVLLGDRTAHRTVYPINDGGIAETDANNDGIPDVAGVTNERNELAVAGTQNRLRAPPQHNLILGNFARLLSFMTEIYSPRLDAIPSQSDPNKVKRQMAAATLEMLALPPPAEEVFVRYAGDGIYDFTVYLPAGESTAYIVIPLASKISGNSEYYKYKAEHDEWEAFDNNDAQSDQYYSAAGSVGGDGEVQCPAADASLSAWTSAGVLQAGHQCVLLKISDGGPNDADNSVNGVVVDPGIIVMLPSIAIELGQTRLLIGEGEINSVAVNPSTIQFR